MVFRIDNHRCIRDSQYIDVCQSIRSQCPASSSRERPEHRRGHHLLLEAVRHRAGQAPARLRQLRHRRAAPQARAVRARRRPTAAQPSWRRGVLDRGSGRHAAPLSGDGLDTARRAARVATRCRRRCGSTIPTARGRSTPSWPTPRRRPSRPKRASTAALPPSPPPAAANSSRRGRPRHLCLRARRRRR